MYRRFIDCRNVGFSSYPEGRTGLLGSKGSFESIPENLGFIPLHLFRRAAHLSPRSPGPSSDGMDDRAFSAFNRVYDPGLWPPAGPVGRSGSAPFFLDRWSCRSICD